METRFVRNIPALSAAEQALLGKRSVCIVGCGGLGGYLAELLARLGIGRMTVVDGDRFSVSNLNRQLLAVPENLGQYKAEAAAQRIKAIAPEADVQWHPVQLSEENARDLLADHDLVLDAVDNVAGRRLLAKTCGALGISFVHGAVHGWIAQTAVWHPGDTWFDRLYPREQPAAESVLAFTPSLCASMEAALAVRLLLGEKLSGGVLYTFDLRDMAYGAFDLTE